LFRPQTQARLPLPCRDYENRPRICRVFTCGKPCVGCGGCCANVVVAMDGICGSKKFLEMHGVTVVQNAENFVLALPAPCKHYTPLAIVRQEASK